MSIAVGSIPALVGPLPADAEFIMHSDSSSPTEKLVATTQIIEDLVTVTGVETLQNKTLDSSNAIGTDDSLVPVKASEIMAGTGGSLVTYWRYVREELVLGIIVDGASEDNIVTVDGATIADMVIATPVGFLDNGIYMAADITGADTVTVRTINVSGAEYPGATIDVDVLVVRLSNA